MRMQFTLALRYLAGRKLRTVLTTLAIVFGVLVLFGMNSMLPALIGAFQANVKAAAGEVDATITLKTSDTFDAAVADQVAATDGVETINAFLNRPINLPTDYFDREPNQPDRVTLVSLVGLDISQATAMHVYPIQDGRFLEAGDANAAVITESLAEAIGIQVGDSFNLPVATGETSLTVVGLLAAHLGAGNEEIYVALDEAQRLLDIPNRINAVEANFGNVNASQRASIEQAILEALGNNYQLGSLTSNSQFLSTLGLAQVIFNLIGVLALLMGGFIIFNTFRTVVAERQRDIGMLRTLGANRRTIIGIILGEGLLQGIIGTGLGILLGLLLARSALNGVKPLLSQYINLTIGPPVVSVGLLAGSIAMGLGITLVAGLLPALSASRVTPLEALRPTVGAVSIKRMAGFGFWSGVAMLVAAILLLLSKDTGVLSLGGLLFIVGLFLVTPALVTPIANLFGGLMAAVYARGGTAQLAEGNLSRQPSRAATTASTTLIALAIVVMAAGLVSSLLTGFTQIMEKSLGKADFLVLPPSVSTWGTNVGATGSLRDELNAAQGVDIVSTFRFAPAQYGSAVVELMGIDPVSFPQVSGLQFSAGDEDSVYGQLNEERSMIINGVMSGVSGAKVGDQLTLLTPSGERTYQVAAIATDLFSAKIPTATVSQHNLSVDFGADEDMLFLVSLSAGQDHAAAEAALKGALSSYPQFHLVDGRAYIEQNLVFFQAAFGGLTMVLLFLAIPSLIAMVNTLAIGVIERTREIGMLRAIGATRKQVRTVILAEALILSGLGTVFGILAGLYLGYLAVQAIQAANFPTQYAFPAAGVLLAIAAGIVFGLIAAIIPARQAARLQVVEALRYE